MDDPPGSPEPQPAPAAPAGAQPTQQPPQNGKAIASLILGIAGCCLIGLLGAVPAIILAVMARKEIRENPGQWSGEAMATTGLVLGIIGTVVSLIVIVLYGALLLAVVSGGFDEYCEENPDEPGCDNAAMDEGGLWAPAAGTDNGHKRAYEAPGYALPGQSLLFPGSEPSSLLAG